MQAQHFLDKSSAAIATVIYAVILGLISILGLIIYFAQCSFTNCVSQEINKPIPKDEATKKQADELDAKSKKYGKQYDRLVLMGEILGFVVIIAFFGTTFWIIHRAIIF